MSKSSSEALEVRVRALFSRKPEWRAEDIYRELFPDRKPRNSTKGGPSGSQAMIHRMFGRKKWRGLVKRIMEPHGKCFGPYVWIGQ